MLIKSFKQFESRKEVSLIRYKMGIRKALIESDLTEEDLKPQGKSAAISFIEQGRPSEWYLEGIVDKLRKSGYDISKIFT